jgi:hypothetical protein
VETGAEGDVTRSLEPEVVSDGEAAFEAETTGETEAAPEEALASDSQPDAEAVNEVKSTGNEEVSPSIDASGQTEFDAEAAPSRQEWESLSEAELTGEFEAGDGNVTEAEAVEEASPSAGSDFAMAESLPLQVLDGTGNGEPRPDDGTLTALHPEPLESPRTPSENIASPSGVSGGDDALHPETDGPASNEPALLALHTQAADVIEQLAGFDHSLIAAQSGNGSKNLEVASANGDGPLPVLPAPDDAAGTVPRDGGSDPLTANAPVDTCSREQDFVDLPNTSTEDNNASEAIQTAALDAVPMRLSSTRSAAPEAEMSKGILADRESPAGLSGVDSGPADQPAAESCPGDLTLEIPDESLAALGDVDPNAHSMDAQSTGAEAVSEKETSLIVEESETAVGDNGQGHVTADPGTLGQIGSELSPGVDIDDRFIEAASREDEKSTDIPASETVSREVDTGSLSTDPVLPVSPEKLEPEIESGLAGNSSPVESDIPAPTLADAHSPLDTTVSTVTDNSLGPEAPDTTSALPDLMKEALDGQ